MDILVYGVGRYGENLLKTIKNYKDINVVGIADSNIRGEKYGYRILDIFGGGDSVSIPRDIVVVIAMASSYNACEIAKRLNSKGYKKVYLYLNKKIFTFNDFLKNECIELKNIDDLTLPSVELHVADFCNLNCRGCTHFSPLFEKEIPDFNKRIQDLYLLKKIFKKVILLLLLGGEPLLNPELGKYINEARKCFPNTEIRLVTNGLLIPKIDDELLKIIFENRITVVITEYQPTHKIIGRIESRLQEFNICYSIKESDIKEKFNRPLSVVANSKHSKKCISMGCISVCDGKIARCPTLMYLHKFNEQFDVVLPSDGILELKKYEDGKILMEKLNEKVPLCDYCIDYEINWGVCGRNIVMDDFAARD